MVTRRRKAGEFVFDEAKPGDCVYPVWDGKTFHQCVQAPDLAVNDYPYCQEHAETVTAIFELVRPAEEKTAKHLRLAAWKGESEQVSTFGLAPRT